MGGLWESAVKQMKLLMRKLIQPHHLRTDELSSILVEIEAVLNSRPLTPLESTDPDNLVLTPGHFLVGRPLVAPPAAPASQANLSTLRRWKLTQRINQDLWHEWKTRYLQGTNGKHAIFNHYKQGKNGTNIVMNSKWETLYSYEKLHSHIVNGH